MESFRWSAWTLGLDNADEIAVAIVNFFNDPAAQQFRSFF
jgi:hypothetical protein